MKRLIFIFLMAVAVSGYAQNVNAPADVDKAFTAKVKAASASLVKIEGWRILVVKDKDFWSGLSFNDRSRSNGSAYTLVKTKLTFMSETFVKGHAQKEIAEVLAHEAGHILCACGDEGSADWYASKVLVH